MGVQAQIFRLVDEKQHILDVALNLYVTWFRKSFWLVLVVRFCHLSQEEDRFSLLLVKRIWSRVVFVTHWGRYGNLTPNCRGNYSEIRYGRRKRSKD